MKRIYVNPQVEVVDMKTEMLLAISIGEKRAAYVEAETRENSSLNEDLWGD